MSWAQRALQSRSVHTIFSCRVLTLAALAEAAAEVAAVAAEALVPPAVAFGAASCWAEIGSKGSTVVLATTGVGGDMLFAVVRCVVLLLLRIEGPGATCGSVLSDMMMRRLSVKSGKDFFRLGLYTDGCRTGMGNKKFRSY